MDKKPDGRWFLTTMPKPDGVIAFTTPVGDEPVAYILNDNGDVDLRFRESAEPLACSVGPRARAYLSAGAPLAVCQVDPEIGPVAMSVLDRLFSPDDT